MRHMFLSLMLICILAGCTVNSRDQRPLNTRQINVTATVGMITDIVRHVGGTRVVVTGLMGPGVDPHLYKPSASDILKLERADIIFYGGLALEGRMVDVFDKLNHTGHPAYAVSADIDPERLRRPTEFKGAYDPHIWFDVTLWEAATRKVAAELIRLDPESAAIYSANSAEYLQELAELDSWIREQVAQVPEDARVLITAHDAFGYFGDQYGFEVRGLQGLSTASEAGAGDVRGLIDFIVARQIKAVFVESSVPQATIEAVQAGARARGWDVQIGGQLFSDAMGADGTPEGTYIGMVRYNVTIITTALK